MSSDNTERGRVLQTTEPILDPRGVVNVETRPLADRIGSLEGQTVGFLDNAKTNADNFLDEVARVLRDEYGVAETINRRKSNTAIPADSIATYLDEHCDAVVNAYGDCGSCTSWCVYDSVDLEKRGTPVATINSDEFVRLGQSESRSLGMPGLPLITVTHPMGDVPEEVVRKRARDAVPEIVRVLTSEPAALAEEFEGKYLGANEELQDEELYCPL
ncbi:MAG: UGSC family (seleno)protein [Halapricum sp.]|jgi:hypothetical protein